MLDGAGLQEVAFDIGILLVLGVVLLTLSARPSRWQ